MLTELDRLFQPDILTAAQWAAHHSGAGGYPSERRLTLAVLTYGTLCLLPSVYPCGGCQVGYGDYLHWHKKGAHRQWLEILDWLSDLSDRPFSFIWVCSFLDFEPDPLRAAIAHGIAERLDFRKLIHRNNNGQYQLVKHKKRK